MAIMEHEPTTGGLGAVPHRGPAALAEPLVRGQQDKAPPETESSLYLKGPKQGQNLHTSSAHATNTTIILLITVGGVSEIRLVMMK